MKTASYPERIRSALFQAINKTAADVNACVKTPGKDFSRKRKLPLQTMLRMLICIGVAVCQKNYTTGSDTHPTPQRFPHLSSNAKNPSRSD